MLELYFRLFDIHSKKSGVPIIHENITIMPNLVNSSAENKETVILYIWQKRLVQMVSKFSGRL